MVTRLGVQVLGAFYAVYWDLSTRKPVRYRDAGVNMESSGPVDTALNRFAELMDELDELI